MAKTNFPRLRFREFDGEWNKENLSKLTDIKDGTHSSPKYQEKGYSLVTSKNLQNGHIDFSNTSKISEEDYDSINKRSLVEADDIIFGMIGTIGNPVLIKDGGFAIKNVALIKHSYKLDSYFVLNFLLSNSFIKHIEMNNEGGTQKFISLNNIRTCPLNIPSKDEQQKIGSFFAKIDKIIELQTQKLEQLKKLKQAYLQKIFPKNGESVPRLRFSGFSGEWKQRKLGDYLKLPKLEEVEVKNSSEILSVKLNLKGIVRLDEDSTLKLGSTKYYKRRKNQFIYGKQNFFNGSMAIIPSQYDGLVTSGDVPSFDVIGIIPVFLLLSLSREDYYKHSEKYANGTGSKRIHENVFLNFDISSPSKDEQCKIINFFKVLNNQIINESSKLDSLNKQKKAYLQRMFV